MLGATFVSLSILVPVSVLIPIPLTVLVAIPLTALVAIPVTVLVAISVTAFVPPFSSFFGELVDAAGKVIQPSVDVFE